MEWLATLITGIVGLAGIGGTAWGVRHQSAIALDGEARQRAYDAFSRLVGVSEQAQTLMLLYLSNSPSTYLELSSLGEMRAQTDAATANCTLVSGGRLQTLASNLSTAISFVLLVIELKGDQDRGKAALQDMTGAQVKFAAAARFELAPSSKAEHRKYAKHRGYAEQVAAIKFPDMKPFSGLEQETEEPSGL